MLGYRLLFTLGGTLFWLLLGWQVLALAAGVNLAMAVVLAVTLWALGGIVGPVLHLTDEPDRQRETT